MSCQVITKALFVYRDCPGVGCLKLNVDGAVRRNPGLAGGDVVLRNEWGRMVLAGSFYYDVNTSMVAKFRALLDGLRMVVKYGLLKYRILIESDSLVLVGTVLASFFKSKGFLGIWTSSLGMYTEKQTMWQIVWQRRQ